ncbi:heparan-alpha-glucosaminide N-acetyltransferase domain-containing protein [Demequina sp. NBRC 110056]|uniref:heparan-alpha-glucosaminide N-acetyltransferase domain-containing protein n=1 Tax=Demequina sp. NBRC 110056 TaxID=1570345 RepID=UPI00117E638B|nr:heparan-alpha-glucosaminide N-acetyltransferase domain-containing protein [Demequina sp. NBRC 110056]
MTPVDPPAPARAAAPTRIDGLDVARAVAVLGMVAAHVGDDGTRGPETDGWGWLWVSHGFPSALFAVLAGVSMSLMLTRRSTVPIADVTAHHLRATRIRIATRGAILIPLGLVLAALETRIYVVLTGLGVMFLLALPLLAVRTRWLLSIAAVLVVGGGWVASVLDDATDGDILGMTPFDALWAHRYPALVWMAYILVGLALGRLRLRADAVAGSLVAGGAALAVAVTLAADALGDGSWWWSLEPHGYAPAEVARNMGVACLVLGACLWLARVAPRLLWPLRAAGSMALTLYVLQILVIWAAGDAIVLRPSNVSLVALLLGLVAFACVWRATLGQGPLERVMSNVAAAAADTWAPRAPSPR